MRLGIFGGTFNPIHVGHLILAESAREALALDRIVFIPTFQPPHKRCAELLDGATRLAMIELAIRDQPAFVASDIELQRQGTSYSIDTVKTLHTQLPMAKLFLLLGADMLTVRWAAWEELKRMCTIVAAQRPGVKVLRQAGLPAAPRKHRTGTAPACPATGVAADRQAGVKWLPMPQVEIAASDIRQRLRKGRSIRYLVPPQVERYIREHRLYQGGK